MYEPRFRITHNMLNSIVQFEVERKAISLLGVEDEVVLKARLKATTADIFHLGHLLGINVTLKVAKKIASGKTLSIGDYRGQYLTNFRNAVEYILSTQSAGVPIQGNILMHLNKILIKNIAEEWDAKYRTSGEEIDSRDDNWIHLRDEDIASVEVQAQALAALEWFRSTQTRIHPLIRVPAVIYRLIRLAPFVTSNKVTALAVCKFLVFKGGLLVNGFLPVVKNFDVYEEEYIEAWKQAANEADDITLWIERFVRNIAGEIANVCEDLNKQIEEHKEKYKQPFLNLNRRQLKILRYLQNIPQVKREEYVEMMDVSTMTAYRDLNELVKKGLVRIEGEGRGTKYMLSSR